MKIACRVDASVDIGTGHVVRCLALAEQLRRHGVEMHFICRELQGHMGETIRRNGYPLYMLPPPPPGFAGERSGSIKPAYYRWLNTHWERDAEETRRVMKGIGGVLDWLIVDHYALDSRWESLLRATSERVMVIDDLADRCHECDLLLDQNLYENLEHRYDALVPVSCRKFLGPQYVLLRREFVDARKQLRSRDGTVRRILIMFGGTDYTNETGKVLDAVAALDFRGVAVDVVIGEGNIHSKILVEKCRSMENTIVHHNPRNIGAMMVAADMSVGAGGITTWERCMLGLPCIAIAVAENQQESLEQLSRKGACLYLGDHHQVSAGNILEALRGLMLQPGLLVKMSCEARNVISGPGGCHFVSQAILEEAHAKA